MAESWQSGQPTNDRISQPADGVIAPTIAGSGRRLLDGMPAIRLESISGTTSPTGSLLVHYRVVG